MFSFRLLQKRLFTNFRFNHLSFVIFKFEVFFDILQVYSLCKGKFQTGPHEGCWNSYLELLSAPKKICDPECRFQLSEVSSLYESLSHLCSLLFNYEICCDSARTTVRMLESLIRLAQGMSPSSGGKNHYLTTTLFLNPHAELKMHGKILFRSLWFWFCQCHSTCKINVQKWGHLLRCDYSDFVHWIIHDYLSNCRQCWECSTLKFHRETRPGMYPANFQYIFVYIFNIHIFPSYVG